MKSSKKAVSAILANGEMATRRRVLIRIALLDYNIYRHEKSSRRSRCRIFYRVQQREFDLATTLIEIQRAARIIATCVDTLLDSDGTIRSKQYRNLHF